MFKGITQFLMNPIFVTDGIPPVVMKKKTYFRTFVRQLMLIFIIKYVVFSAKFNNLIIVVGTCS